MEPAALMKLLTPLLEIVNKIFLGKGSFEKVCKRITSIYDSLGSLVDNDALGISRASVVRVHNGGGNLSSARPSYSSVSYEESRKPLNNIRISMQSIPADKFTMLLIQQLKINKDHFINVGDLPDEAYIKNYFLSQGVKSARFTYIKEIKGGFLWRETKEVHFLAVSTVSELVNLNAPAVSEALTRITSDIKRNLQ